jgi:biopolymer transport protein ExbB/TolQ
MRWERVYAYLILFILSSYCFAFIAARWLRYFDANRQSREFKFKVATALQENRVEEAINLAAFYPESPVASVVNASLRHNPADSYGGVNELKPSMQARQRAIVFITEDLKRGLWRLAAIGWTVQLVGIFLLISGVIIALHGLGAAEGAGIIYIAGALAEALWATIFSILVALPIIWSHKYFAAKADSFILEMDKLSLAIIGQIINRQAGNAGQMSHACFITQELDPHPTHPLSR